MKQAAILTECCPLETLGERKALLKEAVCRRSFAVDKRGQTVVQYPTTAVLPGSNHRAKGSFATMLPSFLPLQQVNTGRPWAVAGPNLPPLPPAPPPAPPLHSPPFCLSTFQVSYFLPRLFPSFLSPSIPFFNCYLNSLKHLHYSLRIPHRAGVRRFPQRGASDLPEVTPLLLESIPARVSLYTVQSKAELRPRLPVRKTSCPCLCYASNHAPKYTQVPFVLKVRLQTQYIFLFIYYREERCRMKMFF